MALTLQTGTTFVNGEKVTPAKLNAAVNSATYTGTLEVAKGGTGASNAATARTNLGILGSNLNSNLANSIGVTQAGSLSGDVIFNTTNAPTVTLTAGTWLLVGSVCARTSDAGDQVWAQFYNSTDGTAFGGSSAFNSNLSLLVARNIAVSGVVTVAENKTIHFKVFRAGSSTLDVGNSAGPAGFIQAVRLHT